MFLPIYADGRHNTGNIWSYLLEKLPKPIVSEMIRKIFKKINLIIGVDIGSHAVKICELQRVGMDYKIISIGSSLLPFGSVEDGVLQEPLTVSRILSELLSNLKIKNKKIGVSISGYSVIVKKIVLDEMSDEELVKYIETEAEQYVPFDLDDVYIDFQRVDKKRNAENKCEIMLVAAKKEVVNDYLDMLDQLKLQTVLVDVDGFALENIWEITSGSTENVALIDIGASKMNINIISEGVSVLARDVAVGSLQLTEQIANFLGVDYVEAEKIKLGIAEPGAHAENIKGIFNKICAQWVLEIKKAIDLYLANHPDKSLKTIVLSGGGSKVLGLSEYISKETGLKTVNFNPFEKMLYDEKKIDKNYLESVAPEMAIAAGLAIRSTSI
jgi:type IV pilus assembly protein PilM